MKTKKGLKNDIDDELYLNEAFKYYSQNKFIILNLLSSYELSIDPENYKAGYFKAFAIHHYNKTFALTYYLKYINSNTDIPEYYRKRWIEFALNISNSKKTASIKKIDKSINELTVDFKDEGTNIIKPKTDTIKDYFIYLDSNGALYLINTKNSGIKRINYHKTRDFIVLNDGIIFNDSINLFKYEIISGKYINIFTFQEDEINILNYNLMNNFLFIKHKDGKNQLTKIIDIKSNEVKNMPDNCTAHSSDFKYLIMEYTGKFDIYTIDGKSISEIRGKFLGFNYKLPELFYYSDDYLYLFNFEENTLKKIIYIPDIQKINFFKSVSYNKIVFSFDDYILNMTILTSNIHLIRGNIVNMFESGFIYSLDNDNNIYYFNFLTNSKILLFKNFNNSDILKSTDADSSLFSIKKDNKLFIYNLNRIKI